MATATLRLPDSYFALVREFPLIRIQSSRHRKQAQAVLDRLLRQDLDVGGVAYLDALTDLVESYETATEPPASAEPRDVLRLLVESSGLTQQQLSERTGIAQSSLSAMLSGNRPITVKHAQRLAAWFGVRPAAFLLG